MKETYFQRILNLKDYSPKNEYYTSNEEIDYINKTLDIKNLNAFDIQNLRDMVVLIYSNRASRFRENKDYDKFDKCNNAMMSITAVIDNAMYNLK